jgi:predicted acyltransferase
MSLDAFRGITIAGMLLVNNPGSWNSNRIHWPLQHAAWNGWTFTDLIFPFFLFIIGVAMMFSFPKRIARGESRRVLFAHVVRRAVGLMLLGYWGSTFSTIFFPGEMGDGGLIFRIGFVLFAASALLMLTEVRPARIWVPCLVVGLAATIVGGLMVEADDRLLRRLAGLRWPGVLVRIGWCYLFASAIFFLTPSPKAIMRWIVALLAVYWILMLHIPVPGFGQPDLARGFPTLETPRHLLFSNWCFYIDYHLLGTHVWGARELHDPETGELIWSFDPEGILSTVSAVCSVLFGVLTGLWITRKDKSPVEKTTGLFVAGCWLLVIGLVMSIWFPINKRIWSSSYTVFMAGMALLFLAMCYHTIDVKGFRRWCRPFVWYGMNAITAFVLSGMMAQALGNLKVPHVSVTGETILDAEGAQQMISLKVWVMENVFDQLFSPINASLAFAICFVILWAGLMGLLHWRRVFLRL